MTHLARATLLILGAGGDLTRRYLLPALARLVAAGALPPGVRVRGAGLENLDDDEFRDYVSRVLDRFAADVPERHRRTLAQRCDHRTADVTDTDDVAALIGDLGGPVVAYLALPPTVFAPAIRALSGARLPGGSRVVVEKPFGTDGKTAAELNLLLGEVLPEEAVFRVDHFLGKQTVQNVLGLRFANRIFEPVWNAHHVERVDIVWDETLALEGRASYYDRAGALRDMLQNHLLQLLCLVAMEPPHTLGQRDLRDRKVQLLRSVRTFGPDDVDRWTCRGRYAAGEIDGRPVPSYVDEPGIDPSRGTETYAEVVAWVDNWRWAGVPFRMRSGKALAADRAEIAVRFRRVPHLAFGQHETPGPNVLRLALDPDRIELSLNLNGAGDPFELEPACIGTELAPQDLPAYSRLLLDVLDGDPSLSIRGDEAEEAWRIMEPILDAWSQGRSPLQDYRAGSDGPPPLRDLG